MKKFLLTTILLMAGCSQDTVRKPYLDKVNQQFVDEANILFNGKTRDLQGYHSYTSNIVSYKIDSENFNINNFLKNKNEELKKMGWKFFKKYNESYIFCNGKKKQLEIIAPRKIIGNKKISEGSVAMQLESDWHIIFYKANNTTWYECYHYKE